MSASIDISDSAPAIRIPQPCTRPQCRPLVVVFVSKGQLAMRRLDQAKITPLAGTAGASYPFFSRDGKWVTFFAGGKLRKTAMAGGDPVTLCDAFTGRGGIGEKMATSSQR